MPKFPIARCRALLSLLLTAVALTLPPLAHAANRKNLSIDAGGLHRDYVLVTPDSLPPGPRPLVLLLHGHLGTAANALGSGRVPSPLSAWLPIADREHVLIAALQGLKGADHYTGWHDCREDAIEDPQVDDVAFAQAVVQDLIHSGRADPHRIYVMGMSNGAMMTLRLALEMQPAPTAVAAVSGTMAVNSGCTADPRPVSVLLIDGVADPIVPFAGGKVGLGRRKTGVVTGFDASRDFWLHADGLSRKHAVTYTFPHLSAEDPTQAVRQTYGPATGPQVETIAVQDGGHIEPSLQYHYGRFYSRVVGNQNRDFESAEEAWSFFKDKVSR